MKYNNIVPNIFRIKVYSLKHQNCIRNGYYHVLGCYMHIWLVFLYKRKVQHNRNFWLRICIRHFFLFRTSVPYMFQVIEIFFLEHDHLLCVQPVSIVAKIKRLSLILIRNNLHSLKTVKLLFLYSLMYKWNDFNKWVKYYWIVTLLIHPSGNHRVHPYKSYHKNFCVCTSAYMLSSNVNWILVK